MLATLEQRLTAMEQEIARLKQQVQTDTPPPWWEEIAATLAIPPQQENDHPQEMSHRESIMALRAKLKPISQEDADMINTAIREAQEMSIADNNPSAKGD